MADLQSLLPRESTKLERVLEQAVGPGATIDAGASLITNVKGRRPTDFLEALIWEYGLTPLRAYVDDADTLIDEGRLWQIERDTYAAVYRGLGWLNSAGTIVPASWRRRWWNSFQIYFDAVPPADRPDLDNIEGVVKLSKAFRSDFRRGVSGYDVPALVFDNTRLDQAQFDDDSGVRLRPDGVKWSFGRPYEIEHSLTATEAAALGLIYPLAAPGTPATWADYDLPWSAAQVTWNADRPTVQRAVNGYRLAQKVYHVALYDAADQVIGYRRARLARQVTLAAAGPYAFDGERLALSATGESFFIEALTGFGDGAGKVAASASVISGATGPASLWLSAGELTGGVEVAKAPVAIELRETVRERVSFLLNF